jgi:hypothetical protein
MGHKDDVKAHLDFYDAMFAAQKKGRLVVSTGGDVKQAVYNGKIFFSQLEADWARRFDELEIRWNYEEGACEFYDFHLGDLLCWNLYVQVLPQGAQRFDKTPILEFLDSELASLAVIYGPPGGAVIDVFRYDGTVQRNLTGSDLFNGDGDTGVRIVLPPKP